MEETKRCPYCGEEILAVAKKCKHCGEWLEDNSPQISTSTQEIKMQEEPINENTASDENDELFLKNIPISNTVIQCLFWVAILGLIITFAHNLISEGESLNTSIGAAKTRVIMAALNFFSTIPEWIGSVLETFGEVVLLLTIRQAMSNMRQSFDNLFQWLVYTACLSTVLFVLVDFMDNESAVSFTALLFLIIQLTLQVILGIKICTIYTGRINYFGKVMSICGGIDFLIFLCMILFMGDEEGLYYCFLYYWFLFIMTVVDVIYLATLKKTLIHPEE